MINFLIFLVLYMIFNRNKEQFTPSIHNRILLKCVSCDYSNRYYLSVNKNNECSNINQNTLYLTNKRTNLSNFHVKKKLKKTNDKDTIINFFMGDYTVGVCGDNLCLTKTPTNFILREVSKNKFKIIEANSGKHISFCDDSSLKNSCNKICLSNNRKPLIFMKFNSKYYDK